MPVRKVSDILRKLADLIDSGAITSSSIHMTSVDPIMIEVRRIEDIDPTYVAGGPSGKLKRFALRCELTSDSATVRSALAP